jgi:murein DD-endopeptidase MepM/ murein hydrolase activator NlpD
MQAPNSPSKRRWESDKLVQYREMLAALTALALAVGCSASPSAQTGQKSQPRIVEKIPVPPEIAPVPARADFWLSKDPVQGGVVIGRAPSEAVSVAFNGNPVPLDAEGFFVIGFDRDAENSASLAATLGNGQTVDRYLPVRPTPWKIEHVNANPTGGAATTAEFQRRRGPELARINAARAKRVDSPGWRQDFIWPFDYWATAGGRLSGQFGAQRIYNGSPGSYHSGMDIAAPAGTIFKAPADGVVVLAASDAAFTLEGHLLMIDHGMGLNSAFLHCSELLVTEGQVVKQGQPIGKVGATGRASGPHLHWGMKWNAARVDPKQMVPAR